MQLSTRLFATALLLLARSCPPGTRASCAPRLHALLSAERASELCVPTNCPHHAQPAQPSVATRAARLSLARTRRRAHICRNLAVELEAASTVPTKEQMLGAVLCRHQRWDLKLDMRLPEVRDAADQVLSQLGPSLVALLGGGAQLFELGALVADGGAPRQPIHPDVPWSRAAAVLSIFVALQDIDTTMGPTLFLPRTRARRDGSILRAPGTGSLDAATAVPFPATTGGESRASLTHGAPDIDVPSASPQTPWRRARACGGATPPTTTRFVSYCRALRAACRCCGPATRRFSTRAPSIAARLTAPTGVGSSSISPSEVRTGGRGGAG